jgi:hypothetical protein
MEYNILVELAVRAQPWLILKKLQTSEEQGKIEFFLKM